MYSNPTRMEKPSSGSLLSGRWATLAKKAAISGAIVTAAPLVISALVFFIAITLTIGFPLGFLVAATVCINKLIRYICSSLRLQLYRIDSEVEVSYSGHADLLQNRNGIAAFENNIDLLKETTENKDMESNPKIVEKELESSSKDERKGDNVNGKQMSSAKIVEKELEDKKEDCKGVDVDDEKYEDAIEEEVGTFKDNEEKPSKKKSMKKEKTV